MEMAYAHLLLIDDTPDEMSQLAIYLRRQKLKVTFAESAKQGYQLAMTLKPDLILMDLVMPVMDGFAICRRLQETPGLNLPPVIFLSSANTLENRMKGFGLGGVDFIAKPFAAEEVLARINVHLRHKRALCTTRVEQPTLPEDEEEIILSAALRLINEDLITPPPLEELAKAVGTHEKRLLKIFRERLSTTVFAYVREARLTKARELLGNQALSIESISAAVGFSSAANFATAFKAREGNTPTEYRRHMRTLSDATLHAIK